jgi:hypothetical protein
VAEAHRTRRRLDTDDAVAAAAVDELVAGLERYVAVPQIGTQKAPTGDFTEELEGEDGDTVVPFDDRRSIRRIILRPEQLRGEGEAEDDSGNGSTSSST